MGRHDQRDHEETSWPTGPGPEHRPRPALAPRTRASAIRSGEGGGGGGDFAPYMRDPRYKRRAFWIDAKLAAQ
ncbi:MAG: hypothetical protein M0C28_40550 [Candidatus Moduliflexus flocculans]|nr:hypothetical protein [Candidatus Moduliflexus flocculans]